MKALFNQARWLVLAALVLLAACASTIGGMRADTQAATQSVGSYAERTLLLVNAGLITKAEAQNRLTMIETAQTSLREAAAALTRCEAAGQTTCPPAQVALGSGKAALSSVELWLIEREKAKRR